MRRSGSTFGVLLAISANVLSPSNAFAQARDPIGAEKLYEDGMKLRKAGDLEKACQRFDDSYALDPAAGTLIQLASCAERAGKVALAWSRLKEARMLSDDTKSETQRKSMVAFIDESIARLEPRLPYLRIDVKPKVEGLVLVRDGTAARAGLELPVDPGKHTIEVSAPGYESVRREIDVRESMHAVLAIDLVAAAPATLTTTIPPTPAKPVEPAPDDAKPADAKPTDAKPADAKPANAMPADSEGGLSGLQVGGLVVGGVGVATLGASLVTGLLATGERARLDDLGCSASPSSDDRFLCPPGDVEEARSAMESGASLATISTITTFAGGALLAGGLAMLLLGGDDAPSDAASSAGLWIAPTAGFGGASLTLGGRF